MAANICDGDVFDKILTFKHSGEETLLKTSLKHVLESDLPFINLVIDSCNGKRGCAFSEACVELAPYIGEIEDVSSGEIDRRIHGKAIQDIIRGGSSKTLVTIALVQHLFSQLIPDKNYIVDCTAKRLPENCPDCKGKIPAGNTAIGSFSTWHGRADIFLNESVAVTVVEECADSEIENFSGNFPNKTDIESSDTVDLEPTAIKKRKIMLDTKTENCVEIEGGERSEDLLTSLHTLDQIVAEVISNGFAQVNMNDSLTNMFIPTIGCTAEHASIFLYDPVNDLLLQGGDLLPLWHVTPSETLLSVFSTVCLWLMVNFTTFAVKNLNDKVILDKSKFHEYMKNKLKFYKEIQTKTMSCNTSTSPRPEGTLTQELRMYCTLRKPNIGL